MTQSGIPGDTRLGRRRSKAWVYYAIIALFGLIAAPASHGSSLLVTLIAGLYAAYIYRGGRIVFWIW
jgi:hypothetical protein